MACWRVLALSGSQQAPQLLIKTTFDRDKYTVFLSDLCNIWSEELDLSAIVQRAAEHESPIDVSHQDTSQLSILLDNVRKSVFQDEAAVRRVTRRHPDSLILHTTVALPAPLDSLNWSFVLQKQSSAALKNELILPLLVSSHIQHERLSSLVATVNEKDKAITRLIDQFDSNNLDLASAFPIIGGSKPGRRAVKREQAARHVPALQPFSERVWKEETGQLRDGRLSSLALFQEALSECSAKVPPRLLAKTEEDPWWVSLQSSIGDSFQLSRREAVKAQSLPPTNPPLLAEDAETDDEFETHENFHLRGTVQKQVQHANGTPTISDEQRARSIQDESTDDGDDDLDAPLKTYSQRQSRHVADDIPADKVQESSPVTSAELNNPRSLPKSKGFRIGGKPKKTSPHPSRDYDMESAGSVKNSNPLIKSKPDEVSPGGGTRPSKKPFTIGGKKKETSVSSAMDEKTVSPPRDRNSNSMSSSRDVSIEHGAHHSSPPGDANRSHEVTAKEEENLHEETAEEKAERKRRELKRKNEELAKKPPKRKKRF
ncbi:XLF-domain-containing protein [Polyplosphaeria fusca]|uniref:Non-homologous end-joining factor 1 n=1 Tax=Polyplosphaeria fusca TaxID=682080 RepID=A0A9P4QSE4_9PLEO|nr:XLF-domain-containing protein [Polyplosphaeria fusca]